MPYDRKSYASLKTDLDNHDAFPDVKNLLASLSTQAGSRVSDGPCAEATQSTTATLTAAQLLGGFINSAPAGAITLTLPSAANMVAGVSGPAVGDAFMCVVENTAGAANSITLAAGGATLRGGTTVAQNKAALLFILLTNVTAGAEAYTVYVSVGA